MKRLHLKNVAVGLATIMAITFMTPFFTVLAQEQTSPANTNEVVQEETGEIIEEPVILEEPETTEEPAQDTPEPAQQEAPTEPEEPTEPEAEGSTTLKVGAGEAYETLQDALAAAKAGDTIEMAAGEFSPTDNGQLLITQENLILKGAGQGQTVIKTGTTSVSGQAGVMVMASNVTIQDLTIESNSTDGNVSALKFIMDADRNLLAKGTVQNVTLSSDAGHGLNIHGAKDVVIDGVTVEKSGKVDVALASAPNVTISNLKAKGTTNWANIGVMFDTENPENPNYATPTSLTLGTGNTFSHTLAVYLERPATAPGGADTFTVAEDNDLTVWQREDGVWLLEKADEKAVTNTTTHLKYKTVKEALATVNDGETLLLGAATYQEGALEINKRITLKGQGADTIIDAEENAISGQAGVMVTADGVTIENLTIKSAGDNIDALKFKMTSASALLNGGLVKDVTLFSEKGHGLNIHGAKDVAIDGVTVEQSKKVDVALASAPNVTISNLKAKGTTNWANVGVMFDTNNHDNPDYATPTSLTLGAGNEFSHEIAVYLERPAAAPGGADTLKVMADGGLVAQYEKEDDGTWKWIVRKVEDADATITNTTTNLKYKTIKEALAAANDEEIVLLGATTYKEGALEISKGITLKGQGADTVIDVEDNAISGQAGVLVTGDGATIENLTIKSTGTAGVSALKFSKIGDGVNPLPLITEGMVKSVTLYSEEGSALNIHGVENMTIDGVTVTKNGKVDIALANSPNVRIDNFKAYQPAEGEKIWANIGIMYEKDNPAYVEATNLVLGEGNIYTHTTIAYSERVAEDGVEADTVALAPESGLTVKKDDNGKWKVEKAKVAEYTVIYSDGVDDKEIFVDMTFTAKDGDATPAFFYINEKNEIVSKPERAGYVFAGWTPQLADIVTENVTYTAIWAKETGKNTIIYTDGVDDEEIFMDVTFNANDGDVTPAFFYINDKNEKVLEPEREGYIFAGWTPELADVVAGNATYTAKWEAVVEEFTVSFNSNGGSAVEVATVEKDNLVTKPADPTKEGFTFEGWYKEESHATLWDFDVDTVTEDVTLYAKWEAVVVPVEEFTVSFNSNGGSAVKEIIVEKGKAIAKPADPIKTDFVFKGWYKDSGLKEEWNFADKVNGNITLFAKWEKAEVALKGFTLSKTSLGLEKGKTFTLQVTSYSPENTTANKAATWKSSNAKVATVDGNGKITAVGFGKADIICTIAGINRACEITVTSTDLATNFVLRLYDVCLGRTPDKAGLDYWVAALTNGRQSGAEVAHGFFFSDEFKKKNVTDEEFVTMMYTVNLNRKPDAAGLKHWMSSLEKGFTRLGVANRFVQSDEFVKLCKQYGITSGTMEEHLQPEDRNEGMTQFVTQLYKEALGPYGLRDWCNRMQSEKQLPPEIAYGFIFSNEFKEKNLTNEEYVGVLYQLFLGRDADKAGFADWVGQLENGAEREHVFKGFAYSNEFKEIAKGFGIVY